MALGSRGELAFGQLQNGQAFIKQVCRFCDFAKDALAVIGHHHLQLAVLQVHAHEHLQTVGVVQRVVEHFGECGVHQAFDVGLEVGQQGRKALLPNGHFTAALQNAFALLQAQPKALVAQAVVLPRACAVPLQIATVGQLLDATRHGHPRQAGLLGRHTGHGPTLGSTSEDDCIVQVKHLYR